MTKKNQRTKDRFEILQNCDRETLLEVSKALLVTTSEMEQYLKERNDIGFFIRHTKNVIEREDKVIRLLSLLHKIFND